MSSFSLLYLRVSTARQAHRGGEAEGYSLPAQREACRRKAVELGAEVIGEYVDAGASARSADREGLPSLLRRLADKSQPPVSFVIVHKLDRLARDRADDVSVLIAIRQAGAQLVSVSEQIDETPAGMLLHGIMASIAEFYSHNLSAEAKKGIAEKARRGGTIGYAPTGYLNTTTRVVGDDGVSREVKTVVPDPTRAPHIAWAFTTYAQGELSLSDLTIALAARGLTTRDSRAVGKALSRASVHRMLSNPYYVGKVVHREAVYDGRHEPLVDAETFARVQDMLAGRKIAGDRSWRRQHYLKGTVSCIRCGSRLGYSHNRGTGGVYECFFCLGRAKKRTDCDLPYLPAEQVEAIVLRLWQQQTLSPEALSEAKTALDAEIAALKTSQTRDLAAARREVSRLTGTKQRLLDAYLAEAVSLEDFQHKQADITAQLTSAQQRLDDLGADTDRLEARLDIVLSLLARAGEFYAACPDDAKQLLNRAVFDSIQIGPDESNGIHSEVVVEVRGLAGTGHQRPHTPSQDIRTRQPLTNHAKNPRPALVGPDGGSNVNNMAVAVGFEPTVESPPHTLSRRAPLAARTRHRRRGYRSWQLSPKSLRCHRRHGERQSADHGQRHTPGACVIASIHRPRWRRARVGACRRSRAAGPSTPAHGPRR